MNGFERCYTRTEELKCSPVERYRTVKAQDDTDELSQTMKSMFLGQRISRGFKGINADSTPSCHKARAGATEYFVRAPVGSALPAGTMAQRFCRDVLVGVLHLQSNPSCRHGVGASWTDVRSLWLWGLKFPRPRWLVWFTRPLPLEEMARVAAQL